MQIATMQIKDLLKRNLNEKIEEIIKVDQADQETVYRELTEYVVTDRIRDNYRTLLKAMAEAPAQPHEGVGVWISGFFGSGNHLSPRSSATSWLIASCWGSARLTSSRRRSTTAKSPPWWTT